MTIGPSQKATGEGVLLGRAVDVEVGETAGFGVRVGVIVAVAITVDPGAWPTCPTFELG